jgi:hypothetical protein
MHIEELMKLAVDHVRTVDHDGPVIAVYTSLDDYETRCIVGREPSGYRILHREIEKDPNRSDFTLVREAKIDYFHTMDNTWTSNNLLFLDIEYDPEHREFYT